MTERGDGPRPGFVATRSVTGTKTDTPITEILQAISVVTQDQITEQGVQTISEALRYTPVSSPASTAKAHITTKRAFAASCRMIILDGMPLPLELGFWNAGSSPTGSSASRC